MQKEATLWSVSLHARAAVLSTWRRARVLEFRTAGCGLVRPIGFQVVLFWGYLIGF